MAIAEVVGMFFDATPILRRLWRWLLERGMEVTILPPQDPGGMGREAQPKIIVALEEPSPGSPPWKPEIYADFALRFINHRTDRKERVLAGRFEIKKSRLFLWRETVFQAPIDERRPVPAQPLRQPMGNVVLEPMSAPVEVECVVHAILDEQFRDTLPKRSELWLVLQMVGPIRRLQRKITILERQRG